MTNTRSKQSNRGFSLIELIISLALIGILSGILASVISVNFKTMSNVSNRKKLVTQGMLAVNLFQRELNMLVDSTSVVLGDNRDFQFIDKFGRTLRYRVLGTTLTRTEMGVGTEQTLATPLIRADSKFKYLNATNDILSEPLSAADLKNVRLVHLILTMDDNFEGIPIMMRVYPENLKMYNK